MRWPAARLEWAVALARRRLLLLNVGIPLLLILPIALGGAPPHHAAAVYTVLFVLFGTMGSAIPLIRDGEQALLARILGTGYPTGRFVVERVGTATALDLFQLAPALAAILLLGRGESSALLLFALLGLTLLGANLVGVWVAALARSLAEGALFGAVVALFLLHGSGVFRTPGQGSAAELLARVLPFGPLHRELLVHVAGAPVAPAVPELLLSAGATFLFLLGTWMAAPRLMRALGNSAAR